MGEEKREKRKGMVWEFGGLLGREQDGVMVKIPEAVMQP